MSPKNNDKTKEFLKILKTLKFKKNVTNITFKNIDCNTGKQMNIKTATLNINNNNNNNLLLKPIMNNTSIKASNNKTCNLIGKMINDVSKTTISGFSHSKQNDKTTTITTMKKAATATTLYKNNNSRSEGGKNTNVYDDDFLTTTPTTNFYSFNDELKTISNDTTTTEQYREKITMNLNEVKPESCLSSGPSLLTNEHKHCAKSIEEVKGEFLVTVKPSLLQNFNQPLMHKNKTIKPLNDSYQRTIDLETSKTRDSYSNQCELLELKYPQQKDLWNNINNKTDKIKTLAERKALLKKEFFKDITVTETESKIPQAEQVKLKSSQTPLNKRVLKKQHNLKLKIPKDSNTTKKPTKDLDNLELSLVALRKLDLQKKLDLKESESKQIFQTHSQFPRVKDLAKKFDFSNKMIVPQTVSTNNSEVKTLKSETMEQRHSPLSDEGCNFGQSPYSSDDDNDSIRTTHTAIERLPGNKYKDKVARSASSDSALGLEVDEPMDISENQPLPQQKRRMTLTVTDLPLRPALLPLAEPTMLPDSPVLDTPSMLPSSLQQTQVPTKVLLEERVVEIPEDPRSGDSSRRESSQSCFSDYPANEMQGVRFVRTPSVVVSDYSDDITCGITLEEIEYFRNQRLRRRRSSLDTAGTEKDAIDNNSDISASSSCSNLYYCGSTISALDGAECLVNGIRLQLERKTSDCSNYSVSGDEEISTNFTIPEQPEDCQDITDMLANQHLSNKRTKKVGISAGLLSVDNPNFV